MTRFGALVAAVALLAPGAAARAQSAAEVLTRGVRAYQNLDLEVAAGRLRRALGVRGAAALPPPERSRALMYLSATEHLRDRRDSAAAVARRLVLADPRYRPDPLLFPPEVLTLLAEARRATKAVTAALPAKTELRPGEDALGLWLHASSFHDVRAAVTAEDGRALRTLYAGPIGDSLLVRWDARDSAGTAVPAGRYLVAVTSLEPGGRVTRLLRLPLDLSLEAPDTLPHPPPPADSLLRPERRPFGPALKALAPGALAGAAAVLLPEIVARDEDASGLRFVVGGAVAVGGIVAFLSRKPHAAIPASVAHNRALREEWRRATATVQTENARRRGEIRLVVRAGEPAIITPEEP